MVPAPCTSNRESAEGAVRPFHCLPPKRRPLKAQHHHSARTLTDRCTHLHLQSAAQLARQSLRPAWDRFLSWCVSSVPGPPPPLLGSILPISPYPRIPLGRTRQGGSTSSTSQRPSVCHHFRPPPHLTHLIHVLAYHHTLSPVHRRHPLTPPSVPETSTLADQPAVLVTIAIPFHTASIPAYLHTT